jgi:type IV fimbrial biogenesis protein FimT
LKLIIKIYENFFIMRYLRRETKLQTKEYGFSLVELMVVVGIIGLLATVGFPYFATAIDDYRLKAAARDVYSDLQKARLQAIKENTLICVNFTTVLFPTTGGGYTVFIDDGAGGGVAGNGARDGTERLLNTVVMTRQNSLVGAGFGAVSRVTYTAKGVIAGSQTGSVTLRNRQRWYRITISRAGGMRLEVSNDGVIW